MGFFSKPHGVTRLVQLDPRFLLLLRIIWFIVSVPLKFIFLILRSVSRLLRRKNGPISTTAQNNELAETENCTSQATNLERPKNLTDSRAFLSFGGVFWVSDLTPQALKEDLLRTYKEDEVVTIKYQINKEEKISDFIVTGAINRDEVITLAGLMSDIFERNNVPESNVRSILVSQELGKYLDKNGIPDQTVPGFSIDQDGVVLVSRYVIEDVRLTEQFFEKIIIDDFNYQVIRSKARETLWNQTISINERMKNSNYYTPPDSKRKYGSFYGHHIIDQDSQITDGIFLGHPAREAIWIDSSSSHLESIFDKLNSKIKRLKVALGPRLDEKIFSLIHEIVRQLLPRDTEQAVRQLREALRLSPDDEVSIDTFIAHETGDCDHQSLLVGYLIERTQKEFAQYLTGKASIDRNWVPGTAHTWVRYSASNGDIYIIDTKRNYIGLLDDYSVSRWPYERPSDLPRQRRSRPII